MPPDKGCISTVFFPCPAAFTAIAQHGSTDGWPHLPAQAGAAAGRKNGMGFIFCCVAAAAQGAMDRACRLGAGTALAARAYMGGGLRQPDYRTAGAGGAVLRSCGLQPGTAVTEELLRTGEYALLESGGVLVGKPEF